MHIRYNETDDLWQYLVSVGPEVWATLPIDAAQITSGSLANYAKTNVANTFSATGNIFSEILRVDKGIKFPATQVASSDVNTLDDYEEGSWNPTLTGAGGATGVTYSSQVGRYVKIGKQVVADWNILLSNKGTITGGAGVGNLPFPIENVSSYAPIGTMYWAALNVGNTTGETVGLAGGSVAYLYGAGSAVTALGGYAGVSFTNTSNIAGTFVYRTDS